MTLVIDAGNPWRILVLAFQNLAVLASTTIEEEGGVYPRPRCDGRWRAASAGEERATAKVAVIPTRLPSAAILRRPAGTQGKYIMQQSRLSRCKLGGGPTHLKRGRHITQADARCLRLRGG